MPSPEDAIPLSLVGSSIIGEYVGPDGSATVTPMDHVLSSARCAQSGDAGELVLGISSPSGKTQSLLDVVIGRLNASRMLACARCKLWWMTPEWSTNTQDLPPEVQFLLVDLGHSDGAKRQLGNAKGQGSLCHQPDGPYALLLPLIDDSTFRATLRPGRKNGDLVLRVESGDKSVQKSEWGAVLSVSAGWDPYELVQRGVTLAAKLSGGAQPRIQKQIPPSVDVFGWCSWDAFYSTVSAKGLQEGLQGLHAGGIFPRLLIIDDGWQSTALDAKEAHIPVDPPATLDPSNRDTIKEPLMGHGEKSKGIVSSMVDWVKAMAASGFVTFYQSVVEPAGPASWVVYLFTLAAKGPLRAAMVDFFGESSDFSRRLSSVKANSKFKGPDAGPDDNGDMVSGLNENLGSVVTHLKNKFGLKYVYCWHGLPGYWGGLSASSEAMSKYEAEIMFAEPSEGVKEVEPSMAWSPASLAGVGVIKEPLPVYNDMHKYLSDAGVDGVKVDCQAGISLIGSTLGGGPAMCAAFHSALEKSVGTHFSNNHVINCMCHSTENIYRMANTNIARVSDDFYPRDPSSSHPHVSNCAYNSLFMSVLVLPDWDMFHSLHPAAKLHGIARAVSGGAVYVSDKPGVHDFTLLRRLVLPDGSILRASQPGRPTRDCLFTDVLRDKLSLLKVWNVNDYCGVVGVFNLQGSSWDRTRRKFFIHDKAPQTLSTLVKPSDVEPFRTAPHSSYVVYSHSQCSISLVQPGEATNVELDTAEADILTVSPILKVGSVSIAPVGLCDMYNGAGAIKSCSASTDDSEVCIKLRGCGRFLLYSSVEPKSCAVHGLSLFFTYDATTGMIFVDIPSVAGDLTCELKVTLA